MVFNHSIKVPTQYRKAAVVLKSAINEKKSAKSLIFEQKHAKIPNLLALISKYSDHKASIENIIEETKILADNPRLDPYLGRILITELLYGAGKLKGEAKPIVYVLSYKDKLEECLKKEQIIIPKKVSKPRYVRVNTNSLTIQEMVEGLAEEGWKRAHEEPFASYADYLEAVKNLGEEEYLVDIHVPSLFVFNPKWKNYWAQHDLVAEKHLMLQDKATCLVGELLNPDPKSVVLDMCAAPGMKTIHVSNLMQNQGTIYALEYNDNRYNLLCKMVSDANATSVKPIKADALNIKDEDVPDVEYIVVDPSCSGSGMQSRISVNMDDEKDNSRLKKLAGLQIKILLHAMTAFPKAKRIVYSTCSLYEEENEQVVQKCLEKCSNFKLLNGKKCVERKWNNTGKTEYTGIGKNCLYSLPDHDFTDGIFIAVFDRINFE